MTILDDPWGDSDLGPFAEGLASALRSEPHDSAAAARPHAATRSAVLGAFATAQAERGRPRARAWRRGLAGALGAVLLAGAIGAVSVGSGPGGPLYALRLDAEEAVLPPGAGPREAAQLDRLEQRLAEIEAASRAGDDTALTASLLAFARIAEAATPAAVPDAPAAARVTSQVAALELVTARGEAAAALAAALRAGHGLEVALAGPLPSSSPAPLPTASPRPSTGSGAGGPRSTPGAMGTPGSPGGGQGGASGSSTSAPALGTPPAPSSGPHGGGAATPGPTAGAGSGSGSGSGAGSSSPKPGPSAGTSAPSQPDGSGGGPGGGAAAPGPGGPGGSAAGPTGP